MSSRQEKIDQAKGKYALAIHKAWIEYDDALRAARAEYERRLAEIEQDNDE